MAQITDDSPPSILSTLDIETSSLTKQKVDEFSLWNELIRKMKSEI